MSQFAWNPVFNLIINIKRDYIATNGILDTLQLTAWLEKLNKEEYNAIFRHLKIKQQGSFALIRYGLDEMHQSMWHDRDSIFRECRSIVLDVEKEALVLTPFRKFFNLNEVEENKLENVLCKIRNAHSVEITDKMDGSMQSARYYDGQIIISGSMALDMENSWRLADGFGKLTENHRRMICEHPDTTFIFEYISIRDAHVVTYLPEQEGMYLIGMRNVYDGSQASYKDVTYFAAQYHVPVTQTEHFRFEEVLERAKLLKSTEKEGWVINIDGHLIKLKCDDYVHLHKVLGAVSSVNAIIRSIADDAYDDLLCKVPENYRERVSRIARAVFAYKKDVESMVEHYFSQAPRSDRKEFMMWVDHNCPRDIQGFLRQKYLKLDYHPLKTCYKNTTKYKTMAELGMDADTFDTDTLDTDVLDADALDKASMEG